MQNHDSYLTNERRGARWRLTDDRGATLVEYALLVALIAISSIIAVGSVASALDGAFQETASSLENPTNDDVAIDGGSDSDTTTTTIAAGSGSDEESSEGDGGSDGDDEGSDDESGDDEGSSSDDGGSDDDDDDAGSGGGDDDDDDDDDGDDDDGDDDDDSGSGGLGGGDDDDDDPIAAATETVSVPGEFSITFANIGGVIVILDLDLNGWEYTITKEKDNRIHLTFVDPDSGKTATVKAWLTGKGELKTSVKVKKSKK